MLFSREEFAALQRIKQMGDRPKGQPMAPMKEMFPKDTQATLQDVAFATESKDGETKKLVICSFVIGALTADMADALGIRDRLFVGDPKEFPPEADMEYKPLADLNDIGLALGGRKHWTMKWKMGPDSSEPSLSVINCKFAKVFKFKTTGGRLFSCRFQVSFLYPTPQDLLTICHGVNESHFLTFFEEAPLLDGIEEDKPALKLVKPEGDAAEDADVNDDIPADGEEDVDKF